MNKTLIGLLAAVSIVGGFVGGYLVSVVSRIPDVAGDFAGGITPSQLLTANTGTGSITPVSGVPNLYLNGALSIGGTGQYDQLGVYGTASTTPLTVSTLGPIGSTTSTATTTASIQVAGLALGDICSGGAATTTLYVSGCVVTAAGSGNATATVAFSNITGSSVSVPTSTVLRISLDHLPY